MSDKLCSRAWIRPVTAVTFPAVALSGLFLALHIQIGENVKVLHEST
ncbi:hypothetical protein [Oryzomonas sagensis]|nr:hypothetical protein [Oryzomonas sagensis]